MRSVWSRQVPSIPLGLSLARESGSLLVLDAEHHLSRYDRNGQIEWRQRAPGSVTAAVLSDDGKTLAALGKRGQIWLMTADLVPIWEQVLPQRPRALALSALGERLAVSDEGGGLHLFDRKGRLLWHSLAAKPFLHLAFVPESPYLVGAAEFGLVSVYEGRGQCLWRDGLVAHVGALAVNGEGSRIVLACFTEGLNCYTVSSAKRQHLARAAPSRLVAVSYLGEQTLTCGLNNELAQRGLEGDIRQVLLLSSACVALAVDALGTNAFAVLSDRSLQRIELASL